MDVYRDLRHRLSQDTHCVVALDKQHAVTVACCAARLAEHRSGIQACWHLAAGYQTRRSALQIQSLMSCA